MALGVNQAVLGWERSVLGTGLSDPISMQEAEDLLPSDLSEGHQLLWAEMLALSARGALDLQVLVHSLRQAGQLDDIVPPDQNEMGGEDYIRYLLSFRGGAMREYVDQILNFSMKRQLRQVAALMRAEAEDERVDAREVMEEAERRLLNLRRTRLVDAATPLSSILHVFNVRMQGFLDGTIKPAWVPVVQPIREIVRYVDKDEYIIIAARPGEGKSSLMRFEFVQAALRKMPCLIFNLENGEIEYAKFALSMVTGIDSEKLKDPRLLTSEEVELVRRKAEELTQLPLYVKTLGSPSAKVIERISRQHILEKGVKLIGVDYIQLVRNGKEKKNDDVTESSGIVRSISLNYGVPVVANAQLSRNIEHRGAGADPQLSDLRESGSLEQDATQVWFQRFVWTDPTEAQLRMFAENINPETDQLFPAPKALPVKTFIAKNRNGGTGVTRPYTWIRSTNRFQDLELRGQRL